MSSDSNEEEDWTMLGRSLSSNASFEVVNNQNDTAATTEHAINTSHGLKNLQNSYQKEEDKNLVACQNDSLEAGQGLNVEEPVTLQSAAADEMLPDDYGLQSVATGDFDSSNSILSGDLDNSVDYSISEINGGKSGKSETPETNNEQFVITLEKDYQGLHITVAESVNLAFKSDKELLSHESETNSQNILVTSENPTSNCNEIIDKKSDTYDQPFVKTAGQTAIVNLSTDNLNNISADHGEKTGNEKSKAFSENIVTIADQEDHNLDNVSIVTVTVNILSDNQITTTSTTLDWHSEDQIITTASNLDNHFADPITLTSTNVDSLLKDQTFAAASNLDNVAADPLATTACNLDNVSADPLATTASNLDNISADPLATTASNLDNVSADRLATIASNLDNVSAGPLATIASNLDNVSAGPLETTASNLDNVSADRLATIASNLDNVSAGPLTTTVSILDNISADPLATTASNLDNNSEYEILSTKSYLDSHSEGLMTTTTSNLYNDSECIVKRATNLASHSEDQTITTAINLDNDSAGHIFTTESNLDKDLAAHIPTTASNLNNDSVGHFSTTTSNMGNDSAGHIIKTASNLDSDLENQVTTTTASMNIDAEDQLTRSATNFDRLSDEITNFTAKLDNCSNDEIKAASATANFVSRSEVQTMTADNLNSLSDSQIATTANEDNLIIGTESIQTKSSHKENDGDEDSSYNDPEHFLKEVFNLMFNEEGGLCNADDYSPFVFDFYPSLGENQDRYSNVGELATQIIYKKMETKYGLVKEYIGEFLNSVSNKAAKILIVEPNCDFFVKDASQERSFFFISKEMLAEDVSPEKLLVLIHGSGHVRAGQWSRNIILTDKKGLHTGTQLPFIERALQENYRVIVMNTNLNHMSSGMPYQNSRSSVEHAQYIWTHYARRAKNIAIVAHSAGGYVTSQLVEMNEQDFMDKVFAIALTDSAHGSSSGFVRRFFIQRAQNWAASSLPLDSNLSSLWFSSNEVKVVSAGDTRHEWTSHSSFNSIFTYFTVMLACADENVQELANYNKGNYSSDRRGDNHDRDWHSDDDDTKPSFLCFLPFTGI